MLAKLILVSAIITVVTSKAVKSLDFDIDSALCENKLSAFLVTDNADVSATPSREYSNVTEEECMETCSGNRDSEGRLVICASFSYDHVIFKCTIYKRKSGPDGDLEKMAAPGKRYFEKFCLDEESPKQCAGAQFVRIDDSILSGYAKNTSIHTTMAGCINQCLREDFVCKSAMYFYEEGECITNVESGQNAPEDFGTPDDGDKVVYFSNGCIQVESDKNETTVDAEEKKKVATTEKPVVDEKTETDTTAKPESESNKPPAEQTTEEKTLATTPKVDETKSESDKEEKDEDKKSKEKVEELKDIESRLYGAKELTRAENGTITETLEDKNATETTTEKAEETTPEDKKETESKETVEAKIPKKEVPKETQEDTNEKVTETKDENVPEKEDKKPEATKDPVFKVDDTTNSEETKPEKVNEEVEEKKEEAPKVNLLKLNPLKVAANKNLQIQKLLSVSEIQEPQQPQEEESYFGKWSDWTECTQPGQRKIRRRKCLNLRKCKGALMQVDWCPKVLPKTEDETEQVTESQDGPIGPTRNPLPVAKDSSSGSPPGILPPQLPQKVLKPLPEGAPGHPDDVWSPWLGVCQQFASNQPCKNNEVIGFESRECIAKDPKACKGPFFRYCTLSC